ncbi:MAG: cytochrome C [Acidimicrobiia bacterium]|nr:cytochrome C [Acidimicrobiia bacterium]
MLWLFRTFVRNGISLLGTAIATAMAVLFVVLLLLEQAGLLTNPYLGLLLFVAVPAAFLIGLLFVPLGLWVDARRRRRGDLRAEWLVVDFSVPRQRTVAAGVLALTAANLVLVSVAAFGGAHYMETTEFCGQVCHTTMEPQYVAHQNAPHSRVACVECHVGSGVEAAIEAKLAGTRQLWHVVTGAVPAPVPSMVRNMRPAMETCGQCHWPQKAHGDLVRVSREFGDDEANTETATTMVMKVGGPTTPLREGAGIHWHASEDIRVEYAASDDTRQEIPYVRVTGPEGQVREYLAPDVERDAYAEVPLRRMDCIDCHNRPAHTFSSTPERAVDRALAEGRIPANLPFARREAVAAVSGEYASRDEALAAIARSLGDFYRGQGSRPDLVERAIAGTQAVWAGNVFPAMRVTWGTYPNHIGHLASPGCFRCHDDSHTAADGGVISGDCGLCHDLGM